MTLPTFGLVLAGVLLNAAAQLLLKAGTNALGPLVAPSGDYVSLVWRVATEIHILGGMSAYALSIGIWILALSRVDVSIAYPMLSIGYVVNAVAAWYLFGEAVTVTRLIGIGVIILGVYIVARS